MPFQIQFLDHVAIRVTNLEQSINWYETVLGLQKVQLPEWGTIPTLMLKGKIGIALFPASLDHPQQGLSLKNVKIDHFAFRVDQANFQQARIHYEKLGLTHEIQDHQYYHSLYTRDPDGHQVELTTLVKDF